MNKGVLFILIIFVGIIIPTHLQASFYSYKKDCINHNLGWNFYCDQQIVEDIDKAQESTELPPKTLAQNAKEKIESLKKREEELRNIAVIYPTQENIKNYLKFNINHLNRSQTFANNAKVAIWQNPSLDINLNGHQPPASGLNKKVWLENLHHIQKQPVKRLNHRFGIFLL